jgi:hypothetical protein
VTQLGKQPADLVKAVARDRDWVFAVLAGWTQAALTFRDAEWARALWSAWLVAPPPSPRMPAKAHAGWFDGTVNPHLIGLLQVMRPGDAERAIVNAIADSFDPIRLAVVLPHLPRPWSAEFTHRYLRAYGDLAERALKQTQVNWHVINAWASSFQAAALAIPVGSIPSAIVLLSRLHDTNPRHGTDDHWERWRQTLRQCIETLRMRQRINEEIPG